MGQRGGSGHTPNGPHAYLIPDMYLERQFRKYCQVHALNAYFGYELVTRQEMQDHVTACASELGGVWHHCFTLAKATIVTG